LNQVNLTANHGEILALIGRNGAGKTTLLKAILGQTPYSGRISYFNCQGKRIDRPRIGYVPQFLAFDRSTPVTVEDLFCANRSRIPVWMSHGKKRQKEAESLLEKVGGTGLFRKKLGALSGGELQRVLLAFALDPLPDLLLLDEPVSAVDRKGVGVFYDLVTSLRSEYHMPVILVSHDLGHVKKYASKAAFLQDGTVAMQNAVDKVLNNPQVREAFGLD
ncbi:MAG: metal ABC transporter ATP-binding protein, partial [[Clostridium] leptum]